MGGCLHATADKGGGFALRMRQPLRRGRGHRCGTHAGNPAIIHDAERQPGHGVAKRHQEADIRQTVRVVAYDTKEFHPGQPLRRERALHCVKRMSGRQGHNRLRAGAGSARRLCGEDALDGIDQL